MCYAISLDDLKLDPITKKYKVKKARQIDEEDEEEIDKDKARVRKKQNLEE